MNDGIHEHTCNIIRDDVHIYECKICGKTFFSRKPIEEEQCPYCNPPKPDPAIIWSRRGEDCQGINELSIHRTDGGIVIYSDTDDGYYSAEWRLTDDEVRTIAEAFGKYIFDKHLAEKEAGKVGRYGTMDEGEKSDRWD